MTSHDPFVRHRIGDLAEVFDGPHATPRKVDQGPWYLNIASLKNGRLDLSESVHIHADDVAKWTARVKPKRGDTLFSYETRLGESAFWDRNDEAVLGRRMGLLRPREDKVDPRFLAYAYLSDQFQEAIRIGTLHGATVNRIPVGDLPNWEIMVPSLPEQRRIAGVLGAFDDLIETNRRLANDSRRLAQAASRAILQGAGDWDSPLPQVASVTKGYSYKSPELVDDAEMHLLNLKNMGRGGTFRFDGYKPLSTSRHKPGQVVDEGDVVVSLTDLTQDRDVIARAVRVQRRGLGGVIVASLDLAVVRPLQGASREFIWAVLAHPRFRDHADGYCNGTTVLHMKEEALRQFEVPKPTPSVLARLDESVRPLLTCADELDAEADDLARQRDELLPLLMSGRVRVSELEGVA